MTVTVSQSGFTDYAGTVANLVDGNNTTFWQFGAYGDNTGKKITFDMGGWFDSSTLGELFQSKGGLVGVPAGDFAIRLSADGVGWYNMPDKTASFDFGRSSTAGGGGYVNTFTEWASGSPYFRYIQLLGIGGATISDPSSGHGQTFNTMDWRTAADGALTITTGANPNPPTAPPDDNGSGGGTGSGGTPLTPPTPDPPADSGANARVTGAEMGVLRTDVSTARVSAVDLGVLRQDVATARVSGVYLGVLMLVATARVGRARASIIG